jgi:hypothetical protein
VLRLTGNNTGDAFSEEADALTQVHIGQQRDALQQIRV